MIRITVRTEVNLPNSKSYRKDVVVTLADIKILAREKMKADYGDEAEVSILGSSIEYEADL